MKVSFFTLLFTGSLSGVQDNSHEAYRLEEYQCFSRNISIDRGNEGIVFNNIELPQNLELYFIKVQQVEKLRITQVQLGFTRVRPSERFRVGNEIIASTTGQNIYSNSEQDLFALPANETYGEGLFFQFDDVKLNDWIEEHSKELDKRFHSFVNEEPDLLSQGASIKQRIFNKGMFNEVCHSFRL